MKRLLLAMMVFGSAHALIGQTETSRPQSQFQPPEALSVTDIPLPFNNTAYGTVVLDILITKTGEIQKVEVRRDIESLTDAAHAVDDWKFSPAKLGGRPIPSRMPVAINLRPGSMMASPVPLPALIPQSEAAIQAEFQPAEVTRSAFPPYPGPMFERFASSSVVLEVNLSAKGEAGEVKVLRDLPPLAEEAKTVVGDWRFMAATLNGHPVQSKIVLAFVYPATTSAGRLVR